MLSLKVPFVCTLPLPLECVRAWARASQRHFKEQCLSVVQSAVTRHTLQAAPLHRFDSVIPHTAWRGPLNFYLLIKITKLLSTVCPSYHQGRYKLPLTMAVEYIAAIATKKSFSPPRGSLSSKTRLQRELPTRPRRSDTNQCFLGWGGEDQSKSKMLYALSAENEADYVESDGNLSPFFFFKLHFHGGICAQIAPLQPRMLQIHLLCVRMLGVSFLGLHVPVLVSRTKHRGSTLLVPLTHSTKTG